MAMTLAAPAVISRMRFCGSFTTSESVDSFLSFVTVLNVICFGIKPWKSSEVRTVWSSEMEDFHLHTFVLSLSTFYKSIGL